MELIKEDIEEIYNSYKIKTWDELSKMLINYKKENYKKFFKKDIKKIEKELKKAILEGYSGIDYEIKKLKVYHNDYSDLLINYFKKNGYNAYKSTYPSYKICIEGGNNHERESW